MATLKSRTLTILAEDFRNLDSQPKNNCLFVCHSEADLRLLDQIPGKVSCTIIVGSDDPDVQKLAREDARVHKVIFLDQMISVFGIIDDVIRIREEINLWLRNKVPYLESYLIEFIKHAEGGLTTQRIQDVLLLIDSMNRILTEYGIRKVFLSRRIHNDLEDEILVRCATKQNIEVVQQFSLTYRVFAWLQLIQVNASVLGTVRALYLPLKAIVLIRQSILLLNILKAHALKLRGLDFLERTGSSRKLIVFLLGSSADKHVDDAAFVMKEFARRSSCTPLALCWSEPRDVQRKFKARNLVCENLESWVSAADFVRNWFIFKKAKKQINVSGFVQSCPLFYRGLLLTDLLQVSVQYSAGVDLFSRLLMSGASDSFFSVHKPSALKVWGELRFDLGRICYESIVKKYRSDDCVFFYYPVGVDGGIGYGTPPVDAINLYFIHGELDRRWHKIAGEKSIQVVAGYSKDTLLKEFAKVTQQYSLKVLGLAQKSEDETYLFYASSPVIRGCISPAEYHAMADSIVAYAAQKPRFKLILKPHASDNPVSMQKMRARYGNPANVHLLGKAASVYHCINASDMVLTKYSTAAMEAMRLKKPVVSVVLDGEKRFQDIFEDAVEKFQDSASCISFIDGLVNDSEGFSAWRKARVSIQDTFLPKKMYMSSTSVEKVIVDTVLDAMAKHGNPIAIAGIR